MNADSGTASFRWGSEEAGHHLRLQFYQPGVKSSCPKGPQMALLLTETCFPGLLCTLLGISEQMSGHGCLLKRGAEQTSASFFLLWRRLGQTKQDLVISLRVQTRSLPLFHQWESVTSSWGGNLNKGTVGLSDSLCVQKCFLGDFAMSPLISAGTKKPVILRRVISRTAEFTIW